MLKLKIRYLIFIVLDLYCEFVTDVSDLLGARFQGVYTYCADSLPYLTFTVDELHYRCFGSAWCSFSGCVSTLCRFLAILYICSELVALQMFRIYLMLAFTFFVIAAISDMLATCFHFST